MVKGNCQITINKLIILINFSQNNYDHPILSMEYVHSQFGSSCVTIRSQEINAVPTGGFINMIMDLAKIGINGIYTEEVRQAAAQLKQLPLIKLCNDVLGVSKLISAHAQHYQRLIA